jgi:UDP:flavonoid glycosyltransferase YjiC (YdhE family)
MPDEEADEVKRAGKVVMCTVGTLGDLHPFIALAIALKRRGVEVTIGSFPEYRQKVEAEGIGFCGLRPANADLLQALGMDQSELTRRVVGKDDFLFRHVLFPHLKTAYEDALAALVGADVVLTSSVAFGGRLAAEKLRIPAIAIVLQPTMFLSAYDPPVFARPSWLGPLLRVLGPRTARWFFDLSARTVLRRMTEPLRAFRAQIGLPETDRDLIFAGQFSAHGAIGLYSPLLGGPQPDHPSPSAVVGFAYYDSEHGGEDRAPNGVHSSQSSTVGLDPELEQFLVAGASPLVFTLGSMAVHHPGAASFYRDSLEATRSLGRRAILLTGDNGWSTYLPGHGKDFIKRRYAPLSLLLPRAAAVIHQGGIGTLAQSLRSGRPELVVPFFGDQFDNAARAARLGVARVIPFRRYRASTATRSLAALLSDDRLQSRAQAVAATLSAEGGTERAAELVCNFLTSASLCDQRASEAVPRLL